MNCLFETHFFISIWEDKILKRDNIDMNPMLFFSLLFTLFFLHNQTKKYYILNFAPPIFYWNKHWVVPLLSKILLKTKPSPDIHIHTLIYIKMKYEEMVLFGRTYWMSQDKGPYFLQLGLSLLAIFHVGGACIHNLQKWI